MSECGNAKNGVNGKMGLMGKWENPPSLKLRRIMGLMGKIRQLAKHSSVYRAYLDLSPWLNKMLNIQRCYHTGKFKANTPLKSRIVNRILEFVAMAIAIGIF